MIKHLCLKLHGGSGYGFTRSDVLDMDLDEAEWLAEALDDQRREESHALKGG